VSALAVRSAGPSRSKLAVGSLASALAVAASFAGCASEGAGQGGVLPYGSGSSSSATGSSSSSGAGGATTAPPGSAAAEYFKSTVFPAVVEACNSCHGTGSIGPQFLGPDADQAYSNVKTFSAIVTDPKESRFLNKGEHAGPALTADQAAKVTDWLELELEAEPQTDDPPVELTPQQQLEAFGKCIRKADWDELDIQRLAQQTAIHQNNNVPCSSCHGEGANGTYLDVDDQKMLEATRKLPFILKFAATTYQGDGTFKDIAASNRWPEKGAEGCPPIGNCHPKYLLDTQLIADLSELFNRSYEHWKKGDCEPPAPPPADGANP
jgi:mono/diheme cytochrome c family protein